VYVRVSVCLSVSVRSYMSQTTPLNLTKFSVYVAMAVARSSSDGFTMHYILPVLWMTSRLHIMALWRVICIFKRR